MRILKLADVGVREKLLSNTCLARTTATNDNANLPSIILNWKRPLEVLLQFDFRERIATDYTLRPKTIRLIPTLYNVKIRSL